MPRLKNFRTDFMNTPPISVPDPNSGSGTFQVKFRYYFLLSSIGSLAGGAPISALFLLAVGNVPMSVIALIVLISTIFGLCVGALVCLIQIQVGQVIINGIELRSTNAWGVPASVKLTDISSTKRINFLTCPYLKVSTNQKKNALWVPLFLSDMKGFRAAVAAHTSPDNPLRIALES